MATRTSPGELDEIDLSGQLMDVTAQLVAFLRLEAQRARGQDEVTRMQLAMLHFLREGPLGVSALARLVGLTRSAVSFHASKLQGLGLIEKTASPDDGRGVLLHLTTRGRGAYEMIHGQGQATLAPVLQMLTAEERRCLRIGTAALGRVLGPRLGGDC